MNPKRVLQSLLSRRGYVLTRFPLEGSLPRELQRLILDRSIDTVVDVGAHEGRYGLMLRKLGFAGRIVSFEPSSGPRGRMLERLDDHWEAHDIALGDRDGTATFFEYDKHDELGSLHPPTDLGASWGTTVSRTVTVNIRTLDAVARDLGLAPERALVKIDTQGHDGAVLTGGSDFVSQAAGLQIEVPMFAQYKDAATATELLDQAFVLGFHLLGLFPIHGYPRPIVPVEFDALFIRQ